MAEERIDALATHRALATAPREIKDAAQSGHPDSLRAALLHDEDSGLMLLIRELALISDNYFCRLATTRFAGGSAVRTACATVRS